MSNQQTSSPRSDSGIASPVWSDSSDAASVAAPSANGAVVPRRRVNMQQRTPTAMVPTFTYTSSESPGGTFRQHFTVNGELRVPIYISQGQIAMEQTQPTSGVPSNQQAKR